MVRPFIVLADMGIKSLWIHLKSCMYFASASDFVTLGFVPYLALERAVLADFA